MPRRTGGELGIRGVRLGDDPVAAQVGETRWSTSLWPKDGGYLVPVKAWVRKAEGLELGDVVTVWLHVDV